MLQELAWMSTDDSRQKYWTQGVGLGRRENNNLR